MIDAEEADARAQAETQMKQARARAEEEARREAEKLERMRSEVEWRRTERTAQLHTTATAVDVRQVDVPRQQPLTYKAYVKEQARRMAALEKQEARERKALAKAAARRRAEQQWPR